MACAMLKAIQVLPTPRDAKIESLYSMDGDIALAPRDRGTGRAAQCTHLYRAEGRFLPEFGIARGEAIAKMSELRRKGARRIDLKFIASDPDVAAITKDVAAE